MRSKLWLVVKYGIIGLWLAAHFVAPAHASDITGVVKTANGSVIQNGTLSLALNQSGIVAGDFAVTTSPVSCYTSTDGSIVGVPNPLATLSAAGNTASGTVPSGTYYVRITYVTFDAMSMVETETLVGPARQVLLASTGKIDVTAPVLQPAAAEGYRVYVGTAAGSTKLQATVTGFGNTSVTSYNSSGAAPPSINNTICNVQFNDTIIPSFTFYRVSLTNSNGAQVPGFPQNWYLAGASVDVSNQYPLAAVSQQTRFPTPILANPTSNAQQSVASPLTLNGYTLAAGALRLPDNSNPPACQAGEATIYQESGVLVICENGAPIATGSFFGWYEPNTQSIIGGQLLVSSRAVQDPATGVYLQLYYDNSGDGGYIKAYDYDTATSKPLHLVSATTADSTFTSTGAATMSSTLAVTGAATLSSTLSAGATTVTTIHATGAATLDGAITAGGALDVAGNFSVATNAFTVAAASGDTAIAGDAAVAGALSLGTAGSSVGAIVVANATSGSITIQPDTGALGSSVVTVKAGTYSVSGLRSYDCGTTSVCDNTDESQTDWEFTGKVDLGSASPSAVTVTGFDPPFTDATTFTCTATPEGATAAIASGGIAVSPVSGSSVTFTGPNTVTTTIHYRCKGR